MATCKVCGKAYRKGAIAFVMANRGLKGARVCQSCASAGVLLVAARPRVKEKVTRATDFDRVIKQLRVYANAASSVAAGNTHTLDDRRFFAGRAEGLESAIALLKTEAQP